MNRGEIYDVDWPGAGRHPAVVVTREVAISVLSNVTVVLITSVERGIRTEVRVGKDEGLDHDSVVNCDNLMTIPKRAAGRYRGKLNPSQLRELEDALRVALELD